ncbi:hypothetical protein MASR2M70_19430 [Bacillota bacterium]
MTGELNINVVPLSAEAPQICCGANANAREVTGIKSAFFALIAESLAQAVSSGEDQARILSPEPEQAEGIGGEEVGKVLWDLSGAKFVDILPSGFGISPQEDGQEKLTGLPEAVAEASAAVMPIMQVMPTMPITPVILKENIRSITFAGAGPSVESYQGTVDLTAKGNVPELKSGAGEMAQAQTKGLETGYPSVPSVNSSEATPDQKNSQKAASVTGYSDTVKDEAGVKTSMEVKAAASSGDLEKQSIAPAAKDVDLSVTVNQAAAGPRESGTIHSPVRTAESPEPYSQIGKEIQAKLQQKGPMEFTMQLEPKELGKIDVRLKVNDGKLTIDIMAANSKTHSLLTGQIGRLVMSMGLQNVKVESVQIGHPTDFSGSDNKQEQSFFSGRENSYHNGGDRENQSRQWRSENNPRVLANTGLDPAEAEGVYMSPAGFTQAPKNIFSKMDYTI